ncbi:hypothetical protein K435DRAFT_856740 [Dendrothele bispora CBS 962.96]|uniref:Uncharacterized protein n=1 Tax=Dendrothele bispora (strain CBS 962.96) TaxID=1314807 RepID=A0A4S8M950_DENBC|nr:hypothetical protein K435DRAFT_856740 [Dendrothele bispora CBS 962.96]
MAQKEIGRHSGSSYYNPTSNTSKIYPDEAWAPPTWTPEERTIPAFPTSARYAKPKSPTNRSNCPTAR